MGIRDSSAGVTFLSDNAAKTAVVKAAPGQLFGVKCSNVNAAARYLRLYNKASAPATTDTPIQRILIPGSTAGGVRDIVYVNALAFSTGIGYRITTGVADNDDTAAAANEVIVNFEYA